MLMEMQASCVEVRKGLHVKKKKWLFSHTHIPSHLQKLNKSHEIYFQALDHSENSERI